MSRAHLAVETLEARAAEEAKRSEAKPKDVLDLERSNAMLEQLLEVRARPRERCVLRAARERAPCERAR